MKPKSPLNARIGKQYYAPYIIDYAKKYQMTNEQAARVHTSARTIMRLASNVQAQA